MKNDTLFIALLFALLNITALKAAPKSSRPNIIIFLTDDQAFSTLGIYGNTQVKTPNLDKLAREGVTFTNNYATTSICMASRACIMTGMYEYKTGCNFNQGPLDKPLFKRSYPVLLREAGYFTGFAGKFGFAVANADNASPQYGSYDVLPINEFDWWAGGRGQTFYDTKANLYLKDYADKYPHSTRAYGAACSDFLKIAAQKNKPFCLSMSFKAGHRPNTPDPFFDDVYADTVWKQPANFGRENAKHLPAQSKLGRQYLNNFKLFGYRDDYQESVRNYNQLIYGVDYAVGMILKELKKQGMADNTIIIFTSDNGYLFGTHGLGGKVLPYEEGSKTPLIIYDPRSKSSGKELWCRSVTANIDIAPTVLEYAGLPIPDNMDGKSLVKVIDNPKKKVRNVLPLIQAWGSGPTLALSMVSEEYKYMYWCYGEKIAPAEELYFLKEDSLELKNVVHDRKHQKALKKLQSVYDEELNKWRESAVKNAHYQEFSTLFDRTIPWASKKNLLPDNYMETYRNELKKLGYEGDIYDYNRIFEKVHRNE